MNLHIEMVNVVSIIVGNDSKTYSSRSDVPNNESNQENNLEGMSSFVDDSQQTSPIQNVEYKQHVSRKGDLAHFGSFKFFY